MRVLVVFLMFAVCGCSILEARRQQEIEAKINTAKENCRPMAAAPMQWAKCENDAELQYWPPDWPSKDLRTLRQAKRLDIASRLERRQMTVEAANAELAMVETQIASERARRRYEAESVAAQRSASVNASNAATIAIIQATSPR